MTPFMSDGAKTLAGSRFTYQNGRNLHGKHELGLHPPTLRHVSLQSDDRSLGVIGLVLDAHELGGGGIEAVARPKRRPLTVYRNPDAPGLVLSFLLEGWLDNRSIEHDCRTVEKMAGGFVSGDPGPSPLIVQSQSVPHCGGKEGRSRRWVIAEQPSVVDEWTIRKGGDRYRYAYEVTLLLSTDADELERIKPRQEKPNTRTIQAKDGDTYEKIAARKLGTKRLGGRLAKLNGDRDADKRLREGVKVVLPTGKQLEDWKDDLKRGKAR